MDNDICFRLGSIIKKRRIEAGLSVEQLSIKSKLNRSTILEIESGKGNPLCGTLVKLSKAFDITASRLVKGL